MRKNGISTGGEGSGVLMELGCRLHQVQKEDSRIWSTSGSRHKNEEIDGAADYLHSTSLKLTSKTHERLKECFLIRQNRTKRANFQGSPLFEATYNNKSTTIFLEKNWYV